MKIVFLDFDGVLNTRRHIKQVDLDPAWVLGGGPPEQIAKMLCEQRIALLDGLLTQADARIVYSTSWRLHWPQQTLTEMLTLRGLSAEHAPVGVTPSLPTRNRGSEIAAWLEESGQDVESFVILDDLEAAGAHEALQGRLVLTHFEGEGLTEAHVERAHELLEASVPS